MSSSSLYSILITVHFFNDQTLYPDVNLSNVNKVVFQHGLTLIKNTVIAELPAGTVDTSVEEWLPPDLLLDEGTF